MSIGPDLPISTIVYPLARLQLSRGVRLFKLAAARTLVNIIGGHKKAWVPIGKGIVQACRRIAQGAV
jgi:hypothetical protein